MAADAATSLKLIVGLGNPGRRYENTKHNVGFDVLGEVARKNFATQPRAKFQGELSEAQIRGQKVLLLCPLTYMNLSGSSVQAAVDFYKLHVENVLVVCDDFALPLARLRFRPSGSSGGQKGLADILNRLGKDVPRLRVGIGPLPERWDVSDYVLSKFSETEREEINQAIKKAVEGVADWVEFGTAHCMNKYNAGAKKPKKQKQQPTTDEASGDRKQPPNDDPSASSENNASS